jgi:hypothetical protein
MGIVGSIIILFSIGAWIVGAEDFTDNNDDETNI